MTPQGRERLSMDIAQDHKERKRSGYWANLVEGETGLYKAEAIDELVSGVFPAHCGSILDIGCGTSGIALALRRRLGAGRVVFMDYDAAVIERLRGESTDPTIEWVVNDIFAVGEWSERFDLILLLDMIHEVYSFYGRPVRDMTIPIDHVRGQGAVRTALAQVATLVNPGGGVIITDNVLCRQAVPLVVRLRTPAVVRAVRRFLDEYPSRRMAIEWHDEATIGIGSHDFCILLTQYNKIKSGQEDRWNVEKFEIHQYMTEDELRSMFEALGFDLHCIIGTPPGARAEWEEDFAVLDGLSAIPEKRVTLLAVKRAD